MRLQGRLFFCIQRFAKTFQNATVISINLQCLMLQANGAHHFRVLLDPDRQNLQSLAIFPENLFFIGTNYQFCETDSFAEDIKIRGSVVVNTINDLPL